MDINPYLVFDGDCEAAMRFYADIFGGEVVVLMRFAELGEETPPGLEEKILHAQIRVGTRMLMLSDSAPGEYVPPVGFHIQTGHEDMTEARRVFAALSADGEVTMEFEKTFWARGFGMCRDKFGVPWMVNCD